MTVNSGVAIEDGEILVAHRASVGKSVKSRFSH